ncbi:MAG: GAF domain-containing protein [Anaerolineae bacterium]|nr:GAF domain-containing protein [Anaerolineae bacterium]
MMDTAQTLHARQLEVLVQVAQLVTTLDLDQVLAQTLKLTTDVVGATKGSFFLLDDQGRTLQRFIAARDMDAHSKQVVSHRILEGGLAGWVFNNKQAALVDDTAKDDRWLLLDDDLRVRSALCVPFFVEGQVRGVMTLEHPEPHHFNADDLRLARAVADQASAALHNAQLFDRVQAQENQLEAVLSSISESVLVVDHDWHICLLNPAAESLIGVSAEVVAGKRLDEISDKNLFKTLVQIVGSAGVAASTQAIELHDDAAHRDFVVNVAMLRQQKSDNIQYVIAMYEVTSIKDLNRLKTHMIRMASHDLKNPLALMVGYLDLIRSDVDSGVMPERDFLDGIGKAIERMESLIETLLDSERGEQGAAMRPVRVDPYELLQRVLDEMKPSADQHSHYVVTNIQQNLQPIKGDFVQLREALNNLFSNAIKYTPDGGTITLNAYQEDRRLYFSIQDTGYGIPADQQASIFQPYFRAQQQETAGIAGTGVGLSLVKEVVTRHGGNVWFISEQGKGSTFGFWLPVLD